MLKTAARRVGLDPDEYAARLSAGEKWCTACKEWHPRDAFVVDRTRGDGRKASCLVADRRRPRGRRNPLHEAARAAVLRAVKAGRLPHASTVACADCGHVYTEGERRHEYDHHAGYEREHWLTVEAVCTLCHAGREKGR